MVDNTRYKEVGFGPSRSAKAIYKHKASANISHNFSNQLKPWVCDWSNYSSKMNCDYMWTTKTAEKILTTFSGCFVSMKNFLLYAGEAQTQQ